MKRILSYIIAAGILSACSLDFDNPNQYADKTFWYSAGNARSGLTGCYLPLRNGSMFGGQALALEDCATPNAYNYANSSNWNDLARGTASSDGTIFYGRWKDCYTGIGRCNTLLKYIDVNQELSAEDILQMKAQARFLRALYYTVLITYYYEVPLITNEPSISQLDSGRTSRAEILSFLFSELDDVAGILPRSYPSKADAGRATAGAALTLAARLHLFEASPLCNPDSNPAMWAMAAEAAKRVMDLGIYSLYPDYAGLFTEAAEYSGECIFDVEFVGSPTGLGHNFDIVMRQYNSAVPVKNFVDSYRMKDGKPRLESAYQNAEGYADMDPRFAQTIVYPGSTWMGETVRTDNTNTRFTNRQSGFIFKKYTVYTEAIPSTEELNIKENCSAVNLMLMRYADVLLMYAESLNEQGLLTEDIWNKTVQAIRKRAGFTSPEALTYPGQDIAVLRDIIHYERRVEFACEGLYYNDLRRWREAESAMDNLDILMHDGTVIGRRTFDASRDYWWPVPASELELAPSLRPNNPGW